LNPTPALLSPLAMVSTSPLTEISEAEISTKIPLVATTSLLFGIKVKSIVLSTFTVEVIEMALTEIFPVE